MLTPDMLREDSIDFVAGYADMAFARQVAKYLDKLRQEPEPWPVPEPKFFSLLRRGH